MIILSHFVLNIDLFRRIFLIVIRLQRLQQSGAIHLRQAAGEHRQGDFDEEAADVNADGEVTMADANQIVNMFLSGGQ